MTLSTKLKVGGIKRTKEGDSQQGVLLWNNVEVLFSIEHHSDETTIALFYDDQLIAKKSKHIVDIELLPPNELIHELDVVGELRYPTKKFLSEAYQDYYSTFMSKWIKNLSGMFRDDWVMISRDVSLHEFSHDQIDSELYWNNALYNFRLITKGNQARLQLLKDEIVFLDVQRKMTRAYRANVGTRIASCLAKSEYYLPENYLKLPGHVRQELWG